MLDLRTKKGVTFRNECELRNWSKGTMADSLRIDSKMRKKHKLLIKLLWNGEKKELMKRE